MSWRQIITFVYGTAVIVIDTVIGRPIYRYVRRSMK